MKVKDKVIKPDIEEVKAIKNIKDKQIKEHQTVKK